MLRDEYFRRLTEKAYLNPFLSANDGARIYWPWRMQPVGEAAERYRNACEVYAVDSDFRDPTIGNVETFDKAHELDAEIAVVADVYQDIEGTVDRIHEAVELYREHPFDGALMAPLQAPYDTCYDRIEHLPIDMYSIGGAKNENDETKLNHAETVREHVGNDVYLHGLGFGMKSKLTRGIQSNPGLLDSVDSSTSMQDSISRPVVPGEERMSIVSAQSGVELLDDLRNVTPYADGTPEDIPVDVKLTCEAAKVGPKTAMKLLDHFETFKNIVVATDAELQEVSGVGPKTARNIIESVN